MKTYAWAAVCFALAGVAGAVGCSSDDPAGDGDGDGGSSDGGSGSGNTGNTGNTGTTTTSSGTATSSTTTTTTTSGSGGGGPTESCDDVGICEGDGTDTCFYCSVAGDETTYEDAGTCYDDYVACFGTDDACTGGNADCCALNDCIAACPVDDASTADVDENLACICTTSDNVNCEATSAAGTCFGDHTEGYGYYYEVAVCVYEVCPSCY